jgi:DNA-binding helix-hairpin-helix protein with protein kinase domain
MNPPPSQPDVVDGQGKPISIGVRLGGGGEGTVYEVKNAPDRAAKVYPNGLSQDRADKIRHMMGMSSAQLNRWMSWPADILLDRQSRRPVGLLIPRIHNKKNVHHLYGPKSRLQDFPRADWRFLIRAAANIAKAFAVVHEARCVIGDVNHGSIMVGTDATVSLIDCESFQISAGTRQYFCEVGMETFTPPELQGVSSFRNISRTADFDNFGLAVIVFHLLFMGRHPFAGRYAGAGDMPIPKAIKEFRFPYGANHKSMQMERPPGTPPLSFVGHDIAALFESAFSRAAVSAARPTAIQWANALNKLEANTKQCSHNKAHWFTRHLSDCPWCYMESLGANPLFPFVTPPTPTGPELDVEFFARQINALSDLSGGPSMLLSAASVSQNARTAGQPNKGAKPIAVLGAVGVFIAGTIALPPLFWVAAIAAFFAYGFFLTALSNESKIVEFRRNLTIAEQNLARAISDWHVKAGPQEFTAAKVRFENRRKTLNDVPASRLRALNALNQNQRKLQLDRFLDQFEIEDANIPNIGPTRKRTLESYGIETAEDVTLARVGAVPGFGPKMVEHLMNWRRTKEAKFIFDPRKAVDPRDVAKVEQTIQTSKLKAEAEFKIAFDEAMKVHASTLKMRNSLHSQIESFQTAVAQARADFNYVSGK